MRSSCQVHPLTWMLYQSKSLDSLSPKMVAYLQCYRWPRSWRVRYYVARGQECVHSLRSPSGSSCASCNPIQPHHTGTVHSYFVQMDNAPVRHSWTSVSNAFMNVPSEHCHRPTHRTVSSKAGKAGVSIAELLQSTDPPSVQLPKTYPAWQKKHKTLIHLVESLMPDYYFLESACQWWPFFLSPFLSRHSLSLRNIQKIRSSQTRSSVQRGNRHSLLLFPQAALVFHLTAKSKAV